MTQTPILTPEQRAQFLSQGYVKISNGMPPESVSKFMDNVWARLGWEENDKSTWNEETVHLPRHREIKHQEFMPRVYQAACELVGGEDKLDPELFTTSGDALIVNSGDDYWATHTEHPRDSGNWHIDGDWFTHYLDSSDQALVVICLFTDVEHGGGPTLICPAALPAVTRYMHDHPGEEFDGRKVFEEALMGIEDYVELTGKAGDVYLAHPFMPHSKSRNGKRNFRVITNPPFTLREPFHYDRKDGNYSLLEQHTLNSLNVDSLPGWHITAPRARFPPRTQPGKTAKIEAELKRMQAHAEKTGVAVDSMHLRGEVLEQAKLDRYPAREAVNAAA